MVSPKQQVETCTGFQWDAGNDTKNWDRHEVTQAECEEIFFRQPLLLIRDKGHFQAESRFCALGSTRQNRLLFVVFTVRGTMIRVISARDMIPSEMERYLR